MKKSGFRKPTGRLTPAAGEIERMGLLQQRRIEAKIFKAFLVALEREYGSVKARSIVASVIQDLAFEKGRESRISHPAGDIASVAGIWRNFAESGALEVDFLEQTGDCLSFRVTRCGYAEAYDAMGLADLGCLLSCERDEPFIRGFSDEITLNRSRTIMEGNSFCEFVYRLKK